MMDDESPVNVQLLPTSLLYKIKECVVSLPMYISTPRGELRCRHHVVPRLALW